MHPDLLDQLTDRPLAIPGFFMKLAMFFVRLTPMPVLRLASRVTAKRDRN